MNYEPGPAIINSGKHSFSYTQVYVVLSRTKRPPPMSFSIPVMVLIAGPAPLLPPPPSVQWTGPFTMMHTTSSLERIAPSCSPIRYLRIFDSRNERSRDSFSSLEIVEIRFFLLSVLVHSRFEKKGGGKSCFRTNWRAVIAVEGESFPRNCGSSLWMAAGKQASKFELASSNEKRNGASPR